MPLTKEQILAVQEPRTESIIIGINSWSNAWGANGLFYFGKDYAYRCVEMGTVITPETKYIFTKVLRYGMNSYDVKMLQTKLGGLLVDGQFGNKTLAAVKAFQSAHGLVPDGVCGKLTNAQLNLL